MFICGKMSLLVFGKYIYIFIYVHFILVRTLMFNHP